MDKQINRWIDRQIDGWTDRWIDGWMKRLCKNIEDLFRFILYKYYSRKGASHAYFDRSLTFMKYLS